MMRSKPGSPSVEDLSFLVTNARPACARRASQPTSALPSTAQTRRHRRDTLRRWRRRAAPRARAVDEDFVTDLRVRDLELDEQWSFAGRKKAEFAESSERGEAWWHKGFARESRLLVE